MSFGRAIESRVSFDTILPLLLGIVTTRQPLRWAGKLVMITQARMANDSARI
jgi:hypothetical protein